jgi:hypothetical protein
LRDLERLQTKRRAAPQSTAKPVAEPPPEAKPKSAQPQSAQQTIGFVPSFSPATDSASPKPVQAAVPKTVTHPNTEVSQGVWPGMRNLSPGQSLPIKPVGVPPFPSTLRLGDFTHRTIRLPANLLITLAASFGIRGAHSNHSEAQTDVSIRSIDPP